MTVNVPPHVFDFRPIPAVAGVGLKLEHFDDIENQKPNSIWFEVHTENYMSDGGPHLKRLEQIRENYPLSFHGVSLSIGSNQPLNTRNLDRTKLLIDRYEPGLVSEHLSWSVFENTYFNDLLPLPYTEETLELVVEHIDQVQNHLDRQILIENPSTYLQFVSSHIPEHEFLVEMATRSGCGLLIDINNLYVNVRNHHLDPVKWLENIPPELIFEIHLAGHHVNKVGDQKVFIDDHGSTVTDKVWDLYQFALALYGSKPSLIEWDTNIPAFDVLLAEASRANNYLAQNELGAIINA